MIGLKVCATCSGEIEILYCMFPADIASFKVLSFLKISFTITLYFSALQVGEAARMHHETRNWCTMDGKLLRALKDTLVTSSKFSENQGCMPFASSFEWEQNC